MSFFHQHDFRLVTKTYAPPAGGDITIRGMSPKDTMAATERAAHGFTTLVWKCSDTDCGKIVQTVALGKEI